MFFKVYFMGQQTAKYYKNFQNAYKAWVEMIPISLTMSTILLAGFESAECQLKQNGKIKLEYDDAILDTEYFRDESEVN